MFILLQKCCSNNRKTFSHMINIKLFYSPRDTDRKRPPKHSNYYSYHRLLKCCKVRKQLRLIKVLLLVENAWDIIIMTLMRHSVPFGRTSASKRNVKSAMPFRKSENLTEQDIFTVECANKPRSTVILHIHFWEVRYISTCTSYCTTSQILVENKGQMYVLQEPQGTNFEVSISTLQQTLQKAEQGLFRCQRGLHRTLQYKCIPTFSL